MNMPKNDRLLSPPHYPARNKPLLLARGVRPGRILFLIHDGTGGIGGYFKLCAKIRSDFAVYGILCDALADGVPRTLSIEQLSEQYMGRMEEIQPSGPYYVAGWSIGGSIAFEMTGQLEERGRKVAFCGLFDTTPPRYYPGDEPENFTLRTELEWLAGYAASDSDRQTLAECRDVDELWRTFAALEGEGGIDSGLFRRAVTKNWPVPDHLIHAPFREVLHVLNAIRSLHAARMRYEPDRLPESPVHLFTASKPRLPGLEEWGRYCKQLSMHTLRGGHYSIFDDEHVEFSAIQLNAAMQP